MVSVCVCVFISCFFLDSSVDFPRGLELCDHAGVGGCRCRVLIICFVSLRDLYELQVLPLEMYAPGRAAKSDSIRRVVSLNPGKPQARHQWPRRQRHPLARKARKHPLLLLLPWVLLPV